MKGGMWLRTHHSSLATSNLVRVVVGKGHGLPGIRWDAGQEPAGVAYVEGDKRQRDERRVKDNCTQVDGQLGPDHVRSVLCLLNVTWLCARPPSKPSTNSMIRYTDLFKGGSGGERGATWEGSIRAHTECRRGQWPRKSHQPAASCWCRRRTGSPAWMGPPCGTDGPWSTAARIQSSGGRRWTCKLCATMSYRATRS